jgi:geranylgeranyl pyrophosphate synthase
MARWSCAISEDNPRGFEARRAEVESAVARVIEREVETLADPVRSAVGYSLSNGGKRMRGMLVIAAYHAAGGKSDASGIAAAIEIIHAYSLVHDDLPCMDDDDMRRGRPSTHRKFGVPVAVAAGSAMIPLAASVAHRSAAELQLPAGAGCTIVKVLMEGAGAGGMIGGQQLDLEGEGLALSRNELDAIHRSKTGALIAASVRLGGLAAQCSAARIDAFRHYGESIGLAFQIMDDVLDVTSSTAELGKTAGRDAELGKSTYPALLGVDGAVGRAASLVEEGCSALGRQNLLTAELEGLAGFIVSRSH